MAIVAKRTNDWLDLLQLPDISWWKFLFATACLVILIWSVVRFVSRIHEDVDPAESEQDMLNAISELRRQGDLTEDEYRSIKSQLVDRISTSSDEKPNHTTLMNSPSVKAISSEEKSSDSESEKSESIQSTTSPGLKKDLEPLHDTGNKTAGSVAAEAEKLKESEQ